MSLRLRRAAVAAALTLTLGAPLSGQSVLLRLSTDEGQVSRYVMGMEMYMEAPMMSSDEPMMTGTIFQTQTIIGVEGDVVEMETVTDSADIAMPGMPMGAGQIPDMTGQSATMKMDTRGRIVELTNVDDLPPEAQQVLGQMGGNGFGMELPENEVGPGDTWTANLDMDMGGGGGMGVTMDMEVTYTLLSVDGNIANISYEGPITLSGDAQGMGMDGSGAISGTIMFDVDKGRLESSDVQVSLDMSAAGMIMSMDQSITMQLIP